MKGNQIPRIKIEPPRERTNADGASLLIEKYAYTLDEWQKMVLDCWLGTDGAGNYTMTSGGLSVSRQNGKNCIVEARELYGLLISGERIIHSAHQVRTAKRSFRRLVKIFTNKKYPEVLELVDNIRYTNGEEAIILKNGGVIEFCSRSKATARGYDGISLIVIDEAQELEDDQLEALMATISASANGTRQILYVGTPPYPNCNGTVFKRFRETVIKEDGEQKNKVNSWHEWSVCADSLQDIKADDKELWYSCNPALGTRLTEEFTQEEFNTLSLDGFCRERLGWWHVKQDESAHVEYAIESDKWMLCKSEQLKPEGKTAYGVKFSPDGAEVCLCGAVVGKDNKVRVSLIERKPTGLGINWLAEWLNARSKVGCVVVIDGRNGTDLLIDKISSVWRFKDSVIRASSTVVITASDMLINEISEQTLTWYSKQEELNESAITSTKRKIGRGYGIGGADSAPIEACSLALYGVRTSRRDPQKKMRIG